MSDDFLSQVESIGTLVVAVMMLVAPKVSKILKANNSTSNGGVIGAVAKELKECQDSNDELRELVKELKKAIRD